MNKPRVTRQHKRLLDQVESLYAIWAGGNTQGNGWARYINGLFEIAKEQNPGGMARAWEIGVRKWQ